MIIGVLAFQGDVQEHMDILRSLRVPSLEVRSLDDLSKVDALIIPGGESTVIARFLESTGVGKEILRRARALKEPMPIYGTCAGAILLARKAVGKNAPKTLGLVDVVIERNAYGTQRESFEASLKIAGMTSSVNASFIRAPRIRSCGRRVEVLSSFNSDPVLVRQGNVMIGTFHPEVRFDTAVHSLFLKHITQKI